MGTCKDAKRAAAPEVDESQATSPQAGAIFGWIATAPVLLRFGRWRPPGVQQVFGRFAFDRADPALEPQREQLVMSLVARLVEMPAVTQRIAIAHEEHRQTVIVAAMFANQLALVIMGDGDAIDGAREDSIRKPADAIIERGIPGEPEAARIEAAAQAIGALDRHADAPAGIGDAAGFAKGRNEFRLPLARPTIVALADGDWVEIRGECGGIGWFFHLTLYNQIGDCVQDGDSWSVRKFDTRADGRQDRVGRVLDIVQNIVQVALMQTISYSEARDNLKSVIDRVVSSRAPIAIVRQRGEGAVLISESEWASMEETMHLLASPANARRLLDSIAEFDAGGGEEHELIEP